MGGGWRRGLLFAAEAVVTEQLLDLIQKNPRHRRDGLGPVSENPPQPLGQGDDPLPHGHRRDHVIDEVGRSLRHVPAVAGRAAAPACGRGGDRAGNAASVATMGAPGAWQSTWAHVHSSWEGPGARPGRPERATRAAGNRYR